MRSSAALLLLPWMGGPAPAAAPVMSPDTRATSGPDRAFDMQELDLDLALLPAERAVQGTATWTVRRLWQGPLVLDQVALDIQAVTGPEGALPFRTEGDTLVIDLPEDFAAAAPATVAVRYRATPRTGLHFREGGRDQPDRQSEIWSQGEGEDNRYWFPGWDHPGDRFAYQGHFTAPEGWQVLTNSGPDLINYLVMVAAGPFQVVSAPDHPEVQAWVPPGTAAHAVARVLDPVPAMMDHFAARTGVPYPWGPYRQIFVQRFLYTGMENTSATIEHERMLVGDEVAQTSDWVESVAAHELAHQWFGDLLSCESWRELWLNEGFATFMAGDWMDSRQDAADHAAQVQGWLDSVRNQPAPMAGRFFQGAGAAPNANVYGRGAAVLQMLRVYLGEDRFWEGIRGYVQAHQHGQVATIDLQRALEASSGRQLDWFFEQWVELGAVPSLTVRSHSAEGRLTVTVEQQVDDTHPRFSLPVTIEVGAADGTVLRRQGWLDDRSLSFELEQAAPPRWVAFDPDGGIAATVDQVQEPAAWQAQLASPSPLARRVAIAALGKTDRSAPLALLLADPAAPTAERQAAAAALGEQRVTAPLVEAVLRDRLDRVRRAAATALARAPDNSPAATLRRVAEHDSNPDVRAAALSSLAAVQASLALPLARSLARRWTDRDANGLRNAAVGVLGEHGDPSDLAALLDPHAPDRLRNDGLSAAARIAGRQDSAAERTRLQARVARAAEPLLSDLDLRTRQHAIGVLGQVGDEVSVNQLEAYRRAETANDAADAAIAAIAAIRGRTPPAATPPGAEQARLQAVEERLDTLEEQLQQLEHQH